MGNEVVCQPETKSLVTQEQYTPTDVTRQINLIQEIMRNNMRDNEHYGKIPGCGNKPSLLKPGAEKLGLVFRLSPDYKIDRIEMPNGHREYSIVCNLIHIPTGRMVGQGVGSCSTMESKYRFRPGPVEDTGKPVPKDYWDMRKSNPAKAQEQIGGRGFSVRKVDGKWAVVIQGEKMENDNPADQWNTVLKMAKKRAHVDAILTATAASDIFTQDIEEIVENEEVQGFNRTQPDQDKHQVPSQPVDPKPQTVAAMDRNGDLINGPQSAKMWTMFTEIAKGSPLTQAQYGDCLHSYIEELIGKKVVSSKVLTKKEATQIIETMGKEPDTVKNKINGYLDGLEGSAVAA